MQNLREISNVLYKCLSQINYIKGNYKLRMFIYIAAYYNYYMSILYMSMYIYIHGICILKFYF